MSGRYDVIALGETMLRLTPPGSRRLEQATMLEMAVGGSESNVLVGLQRLGLRTAWLSRLPDNPVGRLIERALAAQGVDTSHVIWSEEGRAGLYFLEEGPLPRGSRVTYDRAHTAISQMQPHELPSALFEPTVARHLHLTGITPALGPGPAATAQRALELAQAAGWGLSFDLNYRRLWEPAEALASCEPFLRAADLLFVTAGDARLLFGLPDEEPASLLVMLAERYPQATVVLTLGAAGAIAQEPGGEPRQQPAFPAGEVGRVGGGDAFAAGFLYGFLTEPPEQRLARALRWGAATAALKYTIPGDMPLVERAEVEALVNQGAGNNKLVR